jgi:hypothetical protein
VSKDDPKWPPARPKWMSEERWNQLLSGTIPSGPNLGRKSIDEVVGGTPAPSETLIAVGEPINGDWPGRDKSLRGDLERAHDQHNPPNKDAIPDTHAGSEAGWTGQVLEFVGLGFILVPPGLLGEAFLKSDPVNWAAMAAIFAGYWTVGAFVLLIGNKWQSWKPSYGAVAPVVEKAARNIWVWLLLLIVFAFGPSLMVSLISTHAPASVSPACWDGKAPPCDEQPAKPVLGPFVSPIPPGPIGPFTPSWEDAVMFEQAFFAVPRPCLAKIIANTGDELHARNVLSAILRVNKACDVIDEQTDQVPQRVDVDVPAPQKFSGLIIRWHPDFKEGDKLFAALRIFYNVQEGHVMPDNSPLNLILIRVGYGRWHK